MVATNDDLLLELQKHTTILKNIRKLIKNQYKTYEEYQTIANNIED